MFGSDLTNGRAGGLLRAARPIVGLAAVTVVSCQCATARTAPTPFPPAARLEAPSVIASSQTGPVLETVAAGGIDATSKNATPSTSPTAEQADEPTVRIPWTQTAREIGSATAWAFGRFVRSGHWAGRSAVTFDHDSSRNDTGLGSFAMARRSIRGQASIRNAGLTFGPRLLVGNVGLDLMVGQEAYRVGTSMTPGTGRVAGYDVGMTALPERAVSIGFFATRTETVAPRLFGTARDQRTARRGAVVQMRTPGMHSTLNWSVSSTESRARADETVSREGEHLQSLEYSGSGVSTRQPFSIRYRHERRTDLVVPSLSFPLESATVQYGFVIDQLKERNVTSAISVHRRGGTLERQTTVADVRFNYRLSPSLGTRTAYRLDRVEAATLERSGQRLDMQMQHRLYDSLVTTASVRGSIDELRTGRRDGYGGGALLDYRKRLPAGGRLSTRLARTYDVTVNRFSEREDVVLDESHTARFGAPIRLRTARVVPGSIVVSDATTPLLFQEGVDYRVDIVGDFAEIGILPGGRIQDGRVLSIDYRILVSPFTSTLTTQPALDVSVDYGWIAPYVRLQRVGRTLLDGLDDGTVFNQVSRSAGVRGRWEPRNVRLLVNADHRSERAKNLTFESLQFGQVVSVAFGPARVLNVNVSEVVTRFRVPDRRESLGSGSVDFGWQATPILSFQATGVVRVRRDSFGTNEDYYQTSFEARWQRRTFEMFTSAGWNWGQRAERPFSGLRVAIGMSRSFF
jgi:hypothetical protein